MGMKSRIDDFLLNSLFCKGEEYRILHITIRELKVYRAALLLSFLIPTFVISFAFRHLFSPVNPENSTFAGYVFLGALVLVALGGYYVQFHLLKFSKLRLKTFDTPDRSDQ